MYTLICVYMSIQLVLDLGKSSVKEECSQDRFVHAFDTNIQSKAFLKSHTYKHSKSSTVWYCCTLLYCTVSTHSTTVIMFSGHELLL